MPITDSFLTTCRTAITATPELTAFRAARALTDASTRAQRRAAWVATYDDNASPDKSPAYRLKRAVRETVQAAADAAGTLSPLDRESAYRTLAAEFVPDVPAPPSDAVESAELQRILIEELLS